MHCCDLEPRTYSLLRSRKGADRVLRLIMAPMQSSRLKSCNRYTNFFFICFNHSTSFCGREQGKWKMFCWLAKVVHYWKVLWNKKRFIIEKYFGTKSYVDICACQQRNTTEPQQITLLQQTIGVIARSPFLSLALGLWINLFIHFISTYINCNTKYIESSFFPCCFCCLSDFFARSLRPFSSFCLLWRLSVIYTFNK